MPQQFLLPCSCGQKVRVSNAQAGGEVYCVCGKSLSVPTLRGLRQLEPAPAERVAKRELRWTPTHGAIFAGALLVATASVAILGFHLFQYAQFVGWFRPDHFDFTVDRSKEMVQGASAQIDEELRALTPDQALAEFRKTEAEGLGEKQALPWVELKKQAAGHLQWVQWGGAALALSILAAITTLYVGRR